MTTIQEIEVFRGKLEAGLRKLVEEIGEVQIGSRKQFPLGWRKAAKGRTVWRILEELINQNLEAKFKELGFSLCESSPSEVSVYDTLLQVEGNQKDLFVNIKSSVEGGRTNKDDLSKAAGLDEFLDADDDRQLFVATFVLQFTEEMTVKISHVVVLPYAWVPDIYVNPSNNGNLQSSKYKDVEGATQRTSREFHGLLKAEIQVAAEKRAAKRAKSK